MELTIALTISIISAVIGVSNFVLSRKDKSNKDVANEQYKFGRLDEQLNNIFKKLDKIETKLDAYDKDIDERIEKALENHIMIYHKEG